MQVFELKIDSSGDFKNRQFNLVLSQGDVRLEDRRVEVGIGDLLFAEVTGLRGICRIIREGKSPCNALKECGNYLYEKFLGESMAKRILAGEKILLKILDDKTDGKIALIPWEILRDREDYLVKKNLVITRCPKEFFRSPPSSSVTVTDQLRVLVIASQPRDMENLAVNKEIDALCSVFDAFDIGMPVRVDVLTYGCTRERLMDTLENRPPYHILHFIGVTAKNKLIIEDHDGTSSPLYGDELVEILTAINRFPDLMVFAAPFPENPFWKDRRLNPAGRNLRASSRLDRSVGLSYDLTQAGVTSAVVDFRLEMESHALHAFQWEFYYRLIQQNLSIAKSFHSAQVAALEHEPGQWFFPALYGGDALNRPFLFEKTKKTRQEKKVRLTDLVDISPPADFVGRYKELSEIAGRLIYGNARSLCLLGDEGVGKTVLAARAFDTWKNEYDGIFFYSFFPECTLEEFWLDFRLFAIRNRLIVGLSRADLEGRSPSWRRKIIEDQVLSLLTSGRYLLVLDDFQTLLDPKDSDVIFKDKGLGEFFQTLFSSDTRFLICSSLFPQYLSAEPCTVSVLPVEGLEYNDMLAFCRNAPKTGEFLGKLEPADRNRFYQVFKGIPSLLKLFEKWGEKKSWYEALESESASGEGKYFPVSLLFEKVSPGVKKLLSLLVRMKRGVFLPLLKSAFDTEDEEKIDGFSEAGELGLLRVFKSGERFMPERVEPVSIIRAYYLQNPQDLEIFEREHLFYLKRYGKSAVEMGRKWVEGEESESGFRLMMSAWDCLFDAGDFSGALELLREISQPLLDMCLFETTRRMSAKLVEPLQDDREKIVALQLLGKMLASEGITEKMESHYQKCLEINRSRDNREEIASNLCELGAIQVKRGLYGKALEHLQESMNIRAELKLEEKKADTFMKIGETYTLKKDYTTAAEFYSKVLEIRSSNKDYPGISAVLGRLSDIYHKLGDYNRSLELDTRKLEIDKTGNNTRGMTETLLHMADLQMEMEKYEEGAAFLDKCVALEKHLGDQIGIGGSLLKISQIKRRQGCLEDALLYCRQSLEINRQLDHRPGMAANYTQLSGIYRAMKKPEEAVKYAAKSLDLYNEMSDRDNVAATALDLGEIYQEKHDYENALCFYRQSLEIKHDQEEVVAIAYIRNLIANLHYLKGEAGEALEHYGQSLAVYRHLDRLGKIAEVLHHMAAIHRERGNLSDATKLYEECLDINSELGDLSGVASTLGQIGRVLKEKGQHCKAVGKFAASLAIFRHLKSKYEDLATDDLTDLKNQLPEVEYKWCVTAGLEEHTSYLENVEVENKDF
jgi:tetratricopeptide (TPR) repeat protein